MCQVSLFEPGLLSLVRDDERDLGRLCRATAGFGFWRRGGAWLGVRARRRFGRRGDGAELGIERFEHAGGFFAARHAEIEPLLVACTAMALA